ncbi:hypothetical protein VNO78_14958 [Psophocarpus tetragonolobus]|uniref:Expansin n=1 Tax=Psophocarpus tetragonolobus TaxID=3891 RepID=A0AAN9SE65_PSOTE
MVMARCHSLVPLAFLMVLFVPALSSEYGDEWHTAHATFYGDMQGGETMQGACGYGDLNEQGYGLETTALSTALYKNGESCGACFEIKCVNDEKWCIANAGTIKVTATNFCPPNYEAPNLDHWCNPPKEHFDLSMKMFTTIAYYKAGIIPVEYRRVPCIKSGGIKFELKGNPYWLLVLVYNVGNAGDVSQVSIRASNSASAWQPMSRVWGQNWVTASNFLGQPLSFQVTTTDAKTLQFYNVAPSNWQFSQTYQANNNF